MQAKGVHCMKRTITGYCFFLGSSLTRNKRSRAWLHNLHLNQNLESLSQQYLRCNCSHICWEVYRCLVCSHQCCIALVRAHYTGTILIFHEHTKHLDIDWSIIHEKSPSGLVRLLPASFVEQLTSVFANALKVTYLFASWVEFVIQTLTHNLLGATKVCMQKKRRRSSSRRSIISMAWNILLENIFEIRTLTRVSPFYLNPYSQTL